MYVIEDAHWIDTISDSMLADFLAVVPQTPSLVVYHIGRNTMVCLPIRPVRR